MRPSGRQRAGRVALVDDEVDITTYLTVALEERGLEVLACNQATEALARLRAFHPDLICLDLLMPEELGTSLYVAVRRDVVLAQARVLILSGLDARGELGRLIEAHPDLSPPEGYIDKPVDLAAFLTAVDALLRTTTEVPT